MPKPILYVTCEQEPEAAEIVREIIGSSGDYQFIQVETREEAEKMLWHPERLRGVLFSSLRIRTGNTRASKEYMGNGIDLVRLCKDKGLDVMVYSEAGGEQDKEILEKIACADVVLTMPERPETICQAAREVFN